MAFVHADRVKETTTTTGTGTYSLAGAVTGFRTFVAGVGNTNRCIYCVEDGTNWEINEGEVSDAAPDTLTRVRLLASSTGSAISWGAGTRNIFSVYAAAFMQPFVKALTSDYTNSTTTGTEVTGLSVDLQIGTYLVEYFLLAQAAAAATGFDFGINFTGSHTALAIRLDYQDTGSTATTGVADDTVTGDAGELIVAGCSSGAESSTAPNLNVITGVAAAGTNNLIKVEVVIIVGATAGQLELWAASDVAASAITVASGSSVRVTRTN